MTVVPIRSRRRRVAIVHGAVAADAAPDEQDVLVEIETVRPALLALGFAPVTIPLTLDLDAVRRQLIELRPAFVFNLVESIEGQGRLIHLAPSLYESMNLPFTGARGEAMYATSNKPFAKRLLRLNGIDTPHWVEAGETGLPPPSFPGPYIVKSVWEHASIGIDDGSVTEDGHKLDRIARRRQRRLGGGWFAEAYIEGREFNLGLLAGPGGVELLPPAEMLFVDYPADKRRIVDYAAKWHSDSFEFNNTVRRFEFGGEDGPLLAELERIATACWRLFGLNGYARVDCRVDGAGRPWVLEININPCLSPDAGFAAAAARAGLTLTDVIDRIIADLPRRQAAPTPKRAEDAAPRALPAGRHS